MRLTSRIEDLQTIATAEALGKAWLVRLRWFAAAGHVALAILSRAWLDLEVQPVPVGILLAMTALSNIALAKVKDGPKVVAVALAVDVVLLTALLRVSGGAANPFSVLYVIHVAIAARLASRWVTAGIWTLSTLGFGSLFLLSEHAHHSNHYVGMWVAYSLAAALTGYFVAGVSGVLADREAQMRKLQRTTQAVQRVATMSTMAASAAHELGTPLGTISLIAESLEKGRGQQGDATLIAQQVERCRAIVRDLSAARTVESDAISEQTLQSIVAAACADLPRSLVVEQRVGSASLFLPRLALIRTLRDLLGNAAASHTKSILISAAVVGDRCQICIEDKGEGMPPTVLERLGEPYFTTKEEGLGLGLYLATSFAEAIGGSIDIESSEGNGTSVILDVPVRLR